MAELSNREQVKGIIPALQKQGIKPDILLNCAGIQRRHPSEKFPDEDWDEVGDGKYSFLHSESQARSGKTNE